MSISRTSIVNNVTFKGGIATTEKGNEYKTSTIGVNVGCWVPIVGIAAYDVVKQGGFKKCLEVFKTDSKKLKSFDLKLTIISIVAGLAAGGTIDYLINNSRRQKADAKAQFQAQA